MRSRWYERVQPGEEYLHPEPPQREYVHLVVGGPQHRRVVRNTTLGPLRLMGVTAHPWKRNGSALRDKPPSYRPILTVPREVRIAGQRFRVQQDPSAGWEGQRFIEEAVLALIYADSSVVRELETTPPSTPHFKGLPVHLDLGLPDGEVRLAAEGDRMLVGVRPWTPLEVARVEAVRIVRHGMADVLLGLGEDLGPAPSEPYPVVGGRELFERLRSKPEVSEH